MTVLSRRFTAPFTVLAVLATFAVAVLIAEPASASGPLRTHAAAHGKFIGYAAATGPLAGESAYRTIASTEFNQVTAENAMKWDATEPADNNYTFTGADQVVTFAQQNNQVVHGHTLVWHSQTPGWVQSLGASAMRTAMQDHIATVIGRYAANPAMQSWDVVNEVFDDNGNLRNSFWLQTLGQSYIADAFRYARAADSDARLCINDYNVEGINAKSTAMYNLVQTLRSQGVPVNCVGFQAHLAAQYGFPGQVQQNVQRFADLGVQVRFTELDVRIVLPADLAEINTQNAYYTNIVNACLAVTACAGITIWGFTDRYSWVPDTFSGQGQALIYDTNYQPKPAYTAVHNALAGNTGGDGCSVSPTAQSHWGNGYVIQPVTVTNTGTASITAWTVTFTLPPGHTVTGFWNAAVTVNGSAVTAKNLSYNGSLAPNASTTFGFQASRPNGNPSVPSSYTCASP